MAWRGSCAGHRGERQAWTIFGIYDLSEQMGVSPWYWWADVPVQHKDELFMKPGRYAQGPPAVKYRGIFLNDEAPALTGWVKEKYGNYNHEFYVKVFELLLRLKGNYLWPAMWNSAFNEDDPLNPKLADEYGIVMGNPTTSHAARATGVEASRHRPLDYSKNGDVLRSFWTKELIATKTTKALRRSVCAVTVTCRCPGKAMSNCWNESWLTSERSLPNASIAM